MTYDTTSGRWSSTTNKHQAEVRYALRRQWEGPLFTVPYLMTDTPSYGDNADDYRDRITDAEEKLARCTYKTKQAEDDEDDEDDEEE